MSATLALGVVLLSAVPAVAQSGKIISVRASGQIVQRGLCPDDPTQLCQTAIVNGIGQRIGAFTAIFSDRINLSNGSYAGTGLVTTTDGSTFDTVVTGQSTPPDENGVVAFIEVHTIVGGTGQYLESAGQITIAGTADATGHLEITGSGTFIK